MTEGRALHGRRILIVEDDYLIAQVVTTLLEEAGVLVLGPIGTMAAALAFAGDTGHAIDGAILDVSLHGEKSYPIADALAVRGTPFIFATGYGADAVEGAYQHYPRCEKPFTQHTLLTALELAIG